MTYVIKSPIYFKSPICIKSPLTILLQSQGIKCLVTKEKLFEAMDIIVNGYLKERGVTNSWIVA